MTVSSLGPRKFMHIQREEAKFGQAEIDFREYKENQEKVVLQMSGKNFN